MKPQEDDFLKYRLKTYLELKEKYPNFFIYERQIIAKEIFKELDKWLILHGEKLDNCCEMAYEKIKKKYTGDKE